jgi:holo-[acyl-carrier protein] synthase
MIIGIGTDLVEVDRFRVLLKKYKKKIITKILSDDEITGYISAENLAKKFAAKEACSKALKTGFQDGVTLKDIQIFKNKKGAPFIVLKNKAKYLYEKKQGKNIHLSISDEKKYAQAFVIIEN